jgi:hypothetical protein
MTEDEREFAEGLPARAWAPGGAIVDQQDSPAHAHDGHVRSAGLRPRPLSLKTIAGKLLNHD